MHTNGNAQLANWQDTAAELAALEAEDPEAYAAIAELISLLRYSVWTNAEVLAGWYACLPPHLRAQFDELPASAPGPLAQPGQTR